MQALVITPAVHRSARKLVNNYNLAVFYNIVNITLHYAVSAYSLIYMMRNFNVFTVVKVFNSKILLCLFYALGG